MTNYFAEDELDLVVCPECAAPAEVVDRFTLPGTDGPVEHVKVACLAQHWFLLPAASLPAVCTLDVQSETGPVR
jgi:hypothetical protein